MKLFILEARHDLEGNDPWRNPYDKTHKMLVRAEDVKYARAVAAANAGCEGAHVWQLSKYTTCKQVKEEGKAGRIMKYDVHG